MTPDAQGFFALPLSPWLMLLGLLLPGVWRLAKNIAWSAWLPSTETRLLVPGVFVAVWLLGVHTCALVTRNFGIGLVLGTMTLSLFGFLGKKGPWVKTESGQVPPLLLGVMLFSVIWVLPAIIGWDFHDKIGSYSSHFSITSQMLNNIYPPRDLAFAHLPLRYHYGCDTFFAMVDAITRLPLDVAIDGVTFAAWVYTLLLFSGLGKALYGSGGRVPMVLVGAFAGGCPWLVQNTRLPGVISAGLFDVHGSFLNPPMVSYFFQHPWTLGLPMGLMILLLLRRAEVRGLSKVGWSLVAICLITLGVVNVTLCLALGAAMLGSSVLKGLIDTIAQKRFVGTSFLPTLMTVGGAWGVAFLLSGFSDMLIGRPEMTGGRLFWAPHGIAADVSGALFWNAATFGLLLPLGILGVFLNSPLRLVLACLMTGGFLVVNLLQYGGSWDIVKFATVAQLAMSIEAVGVVTLLPVTNFSKILKPLMLILLVAAGFVFHLGFWLHLPDLPFPPALRKHYQVNASNINDFEAIAWLRQRVQPGEIVLVTPEKAHMYAYSGGFPQVWTDRVTHGLGFSPDMIAARERLGDALLRPWTVAPGPPYRDVGISWVLLDEGNPGKLEFSGTVRHWREEGTISPLARFGAVTVYRMQDSTRGVNP